MPLLRALYKVIMVYVFRIITVGTAMNINQIYIIYSKTAINEIFLITMTWKSLIIYA